MRLWFSISLLAAVGIVVACASEPTLPGEQEAPMPSFEYGFTGCIAWSCESGECVYDPATWGACCLETNGTGTGGLARPSCGQMGYCARYPSRCAGLGQIPSAGVPQFCYYATADSACADTSYVGNSSYPNRCGPGSSWDEFPECHPTGLN